MLYVYGWQILSDLYDVCWRSIIRLLAFYVCWRSIIRLLAFYVCWCYTPPPPPCHLYYGVEALRAYWFEPSLPLHDSWLRHCISISVVPLPCNCGWPNEGPVRQDCKIHPLTLSRVSLHVHMDPPLIWTCSGIASKHAMMGSSSHVYWLCHCMSISVSVRSLTCLLWVDKGGGVGHAPPPPPGDIL